MKVSDLMAKLAAMFPGSYPSREGMTAWTEIARPVLGHLEGLKLDRAYEACMASWDKGFAPKPADIAKYAPTPQQAGGIGPGVNMKRAEAEYKILKPRLIRGWRDENRERLQALSGDARWLCESRMEQRAHDAALYEAMYDRPRALQWGEDDWRLYENWKPLAGKPVRIGALAPLPVVVVRSGPIADAVAPAVEASPPAAPAAATAEPPY